MSDKTQVCIIDAGPAGVICAYLFALRGVSIALLEGERILTKKGLSCLLSGKITLIER